MPTSMTTKKLSKLRFSNTAAHIGGSDRTIKSKDTVNSIDPSLNNKVSAAEATWLFKVAEEDYSFRSCDDTPLVFTKKRFQSAISQKFTLSQEKASYVIKHALGPLVASDLCKHITKSPGCFTMFDETTTVQKIKQMDVLVRYWSTAENKVITRYLLSFFFARAPADTLVKLFTELIDNDSYGIPSHRFFNTSSDGPHINKAVWRELNEEMKKRGYKGLPPFIARTLHLFTTHFT